jgi:hypothetical protein
MLEVSIGCFPDSHILKRDEKKIMALATVMLSVPIVIAELNGTFLSKK